MRHRSNLAAFNGPAPISLPERPDGAHAPMFARALNREFDVKAEAGVTEIVIYDEIGFWGVTAKQVREALDAAGETGRVLVRLHSPGGDVFDGIAIYNDLLAHKGHVEIRVVGMAASAASLIMLAGDDIVMADNAFAMIHNAWTLCAGDKHWLRTMADDLEAIDASLIATYSAAAGQPEKKIRAMMDAETWLTAAEAVSLGFADRVASDAAAPKAKFDLSLFRNVPNALKGSAPEGEWSTRKDAERFLMHDAGLTRSQARRLMAACAKPRGTPDAALDDATPDAGEAGTAVMAALARLHGAMKI